VSDSATVPRIRLARPDVGEEEVAAIREVLESGILTNGPRTRAFEEAFARRHGVEHAVAFANGTVALTALFQALGIGPGDEVVVPSMTFVSTATSVLHAEAEPVFAEVDPRTFNLDPADVERRLGPRTRAVVAVHYGGQAADMAELQAVVEGAGAVLVEDAAEAHGASYRGRPVGGLARAAMFSFTPTKNVTTGEGGLVTTGDGELAGRLRLLRNHGQTELYRHAVLGYNWRLTEMQAAMGLVQLEKLDGILARKRANASWLAERLADVPGLALPLVRPDRDHVYMLYTLLLERERDRVLEALLAEGIEARLYFPPAHLQPVFRERGVRLPVTEQLAGRMLSIPFHSRLSGDELEEIAAALERALSPG
jgi:perosamine synthetase